MAAYIYVGAKFADLDSLEHCIKEYERENHLCFYKRDVRTIQNVKNKIVRVKKNTEERIEQLKYYSIKYTCIYGGRVQRKRPSNTGKPRNAKTFRQNCPAHIKILLSQDQDSLSIVGVNAEHNHVISEEIFKKLPQQRKLDKEEEEKVKELLKLKVDKKLLLQQIIQETGKHVTPKDLLNIKARINPTARKPLIASQTAVPSIVETPSLATGATIVEHHFDDETTLPKSESYVTEATAVEHVIGDTATLPESGAAGIEDHIYEVQMTPEIVLGTPTVCLSEKTQRSDQQAKLDFLKEIEMKKMKQREEKLRLKSEKIKLLEKQNQLLQQLINKIK